MAPYIMDQAGQTRSWWGNLGFKYLMWRKKDAFIEHRPSVGAERAENVSDGLSAAVVCWP